MNPNGFVEAASTTSQMSMPMRSATIASSLTSAMLTERKMFSSSLDSSATSGVETGTMWSHTRPYTAAARSVQAAVRPPTTFGVVRIVKSVRPGSTRSGEKARLKSSPARSPDSSSSGTRCSRVVPGKVVDSRTISCPLRITPASARPAPSSGPRSGSRLAVSGVGTQIRIASHSCSSTKRDVAWMRPSTAAQPRVGDVLDVASDRPGSP